MTKLSPASIRQRLLNLSRERGEVFDFILKQYVIQRLLYRLSVSTYQDQFLLKGAMLFLVWTGDLHRPTKDIDLLGFGENDVDTLATNFKAICGLDEADGLNFDLDSIQATQIKEDDLYQGVRVTGFAYLDKAKISFQIDIGFGDAVTPKAELADIPAFLELPSPKLRIYPVYTVIAEKFQAMVALGIANSRMKDFYDVWVIASDMVIEGQLLAEAIVATFERRATAMSDSPGVFNDAFAQDENKQKQWAAFLKKNRLTSSKTCAELMAQLTLFLQPAYQAAAASDEFHRRWNAPNWQWDQAEDKEH